MILWFCDSMIQTSCRNAALAGCARRCSGMEGKDAVSHGPCRWKLRRRWRDAAATNPSSFFSQWGGKKYQALLWHSSSVGIWSGSVVPLHRWSLHDWMQQAGTGVGGWTKTVPGSALTLQPPDGRGSSIRTVPWCAHSL